MRRRLSRFDPSEIPPVSVAREDAATMREARHRLAQRVAAEEAAAQQELERQLHAGDFDQRLAATRAAVAPSEPVAYRFEARQGGFAITAIIEEDLAVSVSPRTTLKRKSAALPPRDNHQRTPPLDALLIDHSQSS